MREEQTAAADAKLTQQHQQTCYMHTHKMATHNCILCFAVSLTHTYACTHACTHIHMRTHLSLTSLSSLSIIQMNLGVF